MRHPALEGPELALGHLLVTLEPGVEADGDPEGLGSLAVLLVGVVGKGKGVIALEEVRIALYGVGESLRGLGVPAELVVCAPTL